MSKKIEYLIKFIKEEKYIDGLIENGELCMRPLGYFAELENRTGDISRGDIREGLLFDSVRVCSKFPIYCMYAVFETDLVEDGILIRKRAVQELDDVNGDHCFALIKSDDFHNQLRSEHFNGIRMDGRLVTYGTLTRESQAEIFTGDHYLAAFVKRTFFEYQQEYRLIVHYNMGSSDDGNYIHEKDIKSIGPLAHCATKHNRNELIEHNSEYMKLKFK